MTGFVLILVLFSLPLALVPAIWFQRNLRAYAAPAPLDQVLDLPAVSVLIPARNEEAGIGPAVRAALESRGVALEIVVLDDHSEDATADVVNRIASTDRRVRLVHAPELPEGWCGKQHACWVLAHEARNPLLVFLDADVRLAPDALGRMAVFLHASEADLASGIPHQETVGLLEKLLIPLIHFILLGFLPLHVMRRATQPQYGAGCGQLFITTRAAYEQAGGHAAIRTTLHDGIKLPRAYRTAGLRTDLFDATDLAECRMYQSAGAVWNGLAKNAGEALGSPKLIVPMTLLLLGGRRFRWSSSAWGWRHCPVAGRHGASRWRGSRWRRCTTRAWLRCVDFANRDSARFCTRSACFSWLSFSGTRCCAPSSGGRPGGKGGPIRHDRFFRPRKWSEKSRETVTSAYDHAR